MAVKFTVRGIPVECESAEEAAILLNSLDGKNGQGSLRGVEARSLDAASYRDFTSRLHKSQKKLLKALLADKDTMSDKTLLTAIGKKDNREIGGFLAGISRNARKSGLKLEAILTSETRHSESGRSKQYTLNTEFRRLAEELGFK